MNADTFGPHVGSIFHVRHDLGHATGLRLIEINRIALTPTLEQFSLPTVPGANWTIKR